MKFQIANCRLQIEIENLSASFQFNREEIGVVQAFRPAVSGGPAASAPLALQRASPKLA
jgi:hypothetical protein